LFILTANILFFGINKFEMDSCNLLIMEEFRDIPGFPGLKATSLGRVIGKKGEEVGCFRGKYVIIGGRTLPSPYTCLSRGNLILRAFVGPPPPDKPEVDHINRNKQDDRPENLRWADRFEQMQNRDIQKNSASQIRGLIERHHWQCQVIYMKKEYNKCFPIEQKEQAIEWLTQKRKELGIQN
jgi:hypothetical protein